tara:strand:- start:59 stop:274 length:216 start_codon:yes stop_codon:yes gene_type:complete
MKVGDLVRIMDEWTAHNPWMKFPDEQPKIGLVTKTDAFPKDKGGQRYATIMVGGEYQTIKVIRLEVVNASR